MASDIDLVPVADPGWDEVLGGTTHDVFHHRGYHALACEAGEGEPFLAVYERDGQRLAWPYLLRPIVGTDLVDVGCVYGYSGPTVGGIEGRSAGDMSAFLADAWAAVTAAWRTQGVVSAFTTFSPMLGNAGLAADWRADPSGPDPVSALGRSVSIDLEPTRAERMAGYEKETRYEIGRARRSGLRTWVDLDGAHLPDLARLYADTMHRNGADPRYLFSLEYFERLWSQGEGRARLLVAALGEEVVGVLLYLVHGEFAHAHLTGVSAEHLRLSPLNAMLDAAADAAQADGARLLHLGAGRGGREDSLYRFKRRIGDVERQFAIGRWVLDADRYAELSHRGAQGATGYFPAYRSHAGASART